MNEQKLRALLDITQVDDLIPVQQGRYIPEIGVKVICVREGRPTCMAYSLHTAVPVHGVIRLISGEYDLSLDEAAAALANA